MIHVNSCTASNFLSIGATPETIDLNVEHTTLIRGTNGQGKTSLFDAVLYGLFGQVMRDVKTAQLINSINKKKLLVEVDFNINGKHYIVKRGQKPAVFEIWQDGEMINQDASVRELQSRLESDILGCNYRTFTQAAVIASKNYTPFMSLSSPDRRKVVETFLDIEVISIMGTLVKERTKEVKQRNTTSQTQLNQLQIKLDGVKRLIASVSDVSTEQVNGIDRQIDALNARMVESEEQHKTILNEKPDIDVEAGQSIYQAQTKTIQQIDGIRREYATNIAVCENENKQHNQVVSFYKNHDDCDRCGQHIDEDFKADLISSTECKITDNDFDIVAHNNVIQEAKERTEAANDIIREITAQANLLNVWQIKLDAIIRDANAINQQVSSLLSQKNGLLSKGSADTTGYHDEVEEFNQQIEAIINMRASITEEIELCNMATEMLKDKGLKAKIIEQYLPLVNKYINDYLDIQGAHYSFMLDDQFSETIKSRYRDTFSYGSFSNGESQRINFAILFMWRKLAESKNTISTNLLLLDEVLDGSLDKEGIDSLFDIFKTLDRTNIFVISHRPEIADRFDCIIDVAKSGNFTKYTKN